MVSCKNFSPIFDHHIALNVNQDSVVIIASSYSLDSLGFESRLGQRIFSFLKPSRPALGPIQYAVQWVAVRGWPEKFSASIIDGNNIGKIFSPKLVHLS